MTVMHAPEMRFNLRLSIVLALIGLLMWTFGLLAVNTGFILPDYAAAVKGSGGVLLLFGLVWVALAAFRAKPAMTNLSAALGLALAGLIVWLTGAWLSSAYAMPLRVGGRNTLIVGALWLMLAVGKLIATTPPKKTR
jgi:hypothetical protein